MNPRAAPPRSVITLITTAIDQPGPPLVGSMLVVLVVDSVIGEVLWMLVYHTFSNVIWCESTKNSLCRHLGGRSRACPGKAWARAAVCGDAITEPRSRVHS